MYDATQQKMDLVRLSDKDSHLVLEHFKTLTDASLRSRFGFSPSSTTLNVYIEFMFKGQSRVFAAWEGERVIGLAHLSIEKSSAELGISILDGHQGKGIGRILIEQCLVECDKENVREMLLLTVAHNFKVLRLLRSYPHTIKSGLDGCMAAIDVTKWDENRQALFLGVRRNRIGDLAA